MFWLILQAAWALDVKVCAQVPTTFLDADVGGTEDYYATNGTRRLRGVKLRLRHNWTGAIETNYAYAGGADKGCATFTVAVGEPYTVRVVSEVEVGGASVTVKDSSTNTVFSEDVDTSKTFLPFAPGATYTLGSADVWNVTAVAGLALHRENLGGAALATFYLPDSGGTLTSPCGPCIDGSDVYLTTTKTRQKFAIAYALGWTHLEMLGGVNFDDSMAEADYNGGGTAIHLISPEYPSAAHAAGYAHVYSALTFNDVEADCGYTYWLDSNWDLLGAEESCFEEIETPAYRPISCATGRAPAAAPYNQSDYYEHMDLAADLTDPFETAADVMRFWWDGMASSSLAFDEVSTAVDSVSGSWSTQGAIAFEGALVPASLTSGAFDVLEARHGIQ